MHFTYAGERMTLVTTAYATGGLAVQVRCEDGSPYATLSVNIPGTSLPADTFWFKDYSENADIAKAVLAAGLVCCVEDIAPAKTGFVTVRACRISSPLAILARPLSPLAEAEIAAGEHEADHGGYDTNCGTCEELQDAIWREFRAVNA